MTKNLPTKSEAFPPMLAYDIAMNIINQLSGKPEAWTDDDLFAIYGFDKEQLEAYRNDKDFQIAVHQAVQELKESGGTIKQKSRMLLEHYMDTELPRLIAMPVDEVPAKDRIALFQLLSKLSGMDTDKSKEATGADGKPATQQPLFNLIIQQPQQEPKTVEPSFTVIQQG